MKNIILCMSAILLAGCSYPITYNTNPIGATLVCGGETIGYTPETLYYKKSDLKKSPYTQKCEAIWISGLEKFFHKNTVMP